MREPHTRHRVNAVLVGSGGFGLTWWEPLAAHADRVQVVAVVDPDPTARARAARHFALPADRARKELDAELLREVAAGLVIDSSPPPFRKAHALTTLRQDVSLLAAKPLGWSLATAEEIVAAGRWPHSVSVVQQMRCFPCFAALRELLRAQPHGPVLAVSVRMALESHGWASGMDWRIEMDHPVFLEAAIHHLDLMRFCLGTELSVLGAAEWNPPWSPFKNGGAVAVLLRTREGTPVRYEATLAPREGEPLVRFDSGWEVVCQGARITVVDGGVFIDGECVGVPTTPRPAPLHELNSVLLAQWLRARETGRPVPVSGQDNLRSMRLLDEAMRAAGTAESPPWQRPAPGPDA
jgi:predicted dehydrogenase